MLIRLRTLSGWPCRNWGSILQFSQLRCRISTMVMPKRRGKPHGRSTKKQQKIIADEHIVYGSDFPHSPAKVILAKKTHFDENREYDGIREKIYSGNAAMLLGRSV